MSKEVTEQRNVTEEWDFIYLVTNDLFIDTAKHDGVTVVYQYLCLNFTSIDTWDAGEDVTDGIVVNSEIHDDAVIRCDLWCYLDTQYRFLEFDLCRTA